MATNLGLGILIGTVLALTGAGGGILAVPLLVFGAHLGIVQAAPIGLLAVGMASCLGGFLGLRNGTVRYRAALLLALTGALASPLGAAIARAMDTRALAILFALVMLFVAWRAFRRDGGKQEQGSRVPPCVRAPVDGRFIWTSRCARSLAWSGATAGLLSGMLGAGGGFVLVPALRRHTDLGMQSIVPTSLAIIALVSGAGVAANTVAGNLDWAVALPFAAGALLGMLAGRRLAARLAGPGMQKAFGLAAAAAAVGMIAQAVT